MFTGLIEEIGIVKGINFDGKQFKLAIAAKTVLEEVKLGDSIAINGICLTVTEYTEHSFVVDVMPQTQKSTTIKSLKINERVNLERALAANSRLGGHFVTGHVDSTGTIASIKPDANAIFIEIAMDAYYAKYLVPKGAITVDGISLTVFNVSNNRFSLSLIPHSSDKTTLTEKKIGDEINLEFDILAKYTEKLLRQSLNSEQPTQKNTGVTLETLTKYGFK
ncbi:riboflavin synthase [Thorsellia kenyensis]|uniref:Riboflavin synthase n=1 Tax=Thorsellia kenyensis TaxID=1549888 RepID=A0ABV6C8I9_9GAMM